MVNLPGLAGSPSADRCLVMGVVNVTPDSFSDGGQWFGATAAIEHGLELVAQGADIVDVGGESTRPGAQRVTAEEELRRVKPVITELVRAGAVVSIDTMRTVVAEWAVEAGVSLVNDVSGGLADPYMPRLVGKAGIPYVVMHWRGHSHDMQTRAIYADVVREVHDELARRVDAVTAEGVDPSMIVLDPGLGFSKNNAARGPDAHNWQLLAALPELATIGGRYFPVLVGASRKRYLSRLGYLPGGRPPVPPGVRAGGHDREDRDLIVPAPADGLPGGRSQVPPDARAGGHDREDRDLIVPAPADGLPGGRSQVPPDARAGGHDREDRDREDREPGQRQQPYSPYLANDAATAAITAIVAAAGAWCVRVHQVPANADAVRVAAAYRAAGRS